MTARIDADTLRRCVDAVLLIRKTASPRNHYWTDAEQTTYLIGWDDALRTLAEHSA